MSENKHSDKQKTAEQPASRMRLSRRVLNRSRQGLAPVRYIRFRSYVMEQRPDPVRKPFPYAIILCFVAIVAVAMYVLSLHITVDNLMAEISSMENEISESREEENALRVRLNAKYDLTEIERIAKEEYGMVPRDILAKKYISISGEDEIEVLDPSESRRKAEGAE